MSAECVVWVKKNSPYSGAMFMVHLMMAELANDTYDYRLWCGDKKLAHDARVSTKTLQRARATMVTEGYLEVLDTKSAPGKSREYRFLMPEMAFSNGGHGVQCQSATVDIVSTERWTSGPSSPITNRSKTQSAFDVLFAQAWEHYPRKKSKQLAKAKFVATLRRGVDPSSLIAATKSYAEHVRTEQTEERYIMLPSTFYGPNERWRDYEPKPELVPPAWLLEVAAAYDAWEASGGGDAAAMPTIPRHPDGGLVDREGRRYTYDPNTNDRVYF